MLFVAPTMNADVRRGMSCLSTLPPLTRRGRASAWTHERPDLSEKSGGFGWVHLQETAFGPLPVTDGSDLVAMKQTSIAYRILQQ